MAAVRKLKKAGLERKWGREERWCDRTVEHTSKGDKSWTQKTGLNSRRDKMNMLSAMGWKRRFEGCGPRSRPVSTARAAPFLWFFFLILLSFATSACDQPRNQWYGHCKTEVEPCGVHMPGPKSLTEGQWQEPLVSVEPHRPTMINVGTETAFRQNHCKHFQKSKHL